MRLSPRWLRRRRRARYRGHRIEFLISQGSGSDRPSAVPLGPFSGGGVGACPPARPASPGAILSPDRESPSAVDEKTRARRSRPDATRVAISQPDRSRISRTAAVFVAPTLTAVPGAAEIRSQGRGWHVSAGVVATGAETGERCSDLAGVHDQEVGISSRGTLPRVLAADPGVPGPALPALYPSRVRMPQLPQIPADRSGAGDGGRGSARPPYSTTPRPPLVGERPGRLETRRG